MRFRVARARVLVGWFVAVVAEPFAVIAVELGAIGRLVVVVTIIGAIIVTIEGAIIVAIIATIVVRIVIVTTIELWLEFG